MKVAGGYHPTNMTEPLLMLLVTAVLFTAFTNQNVSYKKKRKSNPHLPKRVKSLDIKWYTNIILYYIVIIIIAFWGLLCDYLHISLFEFIIYTNSSH